MLRESLETCQGRKRTGPQCTAGHVRRHGEGCYSQYRRNTLDRKDGEHSEGSVGDLGERHGTLVLVHVVRYPVTPHPPCSIHKELPKREPREHREMGVKERHGAHLRSPGVEPSRLRLLSRKDEAGRRGEKSAGSKRRGVLRLPEKAERSRLSLLRTRRAPDVGSGYAGVVREIPS